MPPDLGGVIIFRDIEMVSPQLVSLLLKTLYIVKLFFKGSKVELTGSCK